MAKKWFPMPAPIEAALQERVEQRYSDLMAKLPKLGVPNPGITHEVSADGFSAEVRFYFENGRSSSSHWKYTNRDQRWFMSSDWND